MSTTTPSKSHTYRIAVAGVVDPEWSDRLGGVRIQPQPDNASSDSVTVLEGPIQDQAQLSGILNTLYELHYALLRVEKLESH